MKILVFKAAVCVLLFSYSSSEASFKKFQFIKNIDEGLNFQENSTSGERSSPYQKCTLNPDGKHSDVKFFYNYMNLNLNDWRESCIELDANQTENLKAIDPTAPFKFLIHGFMMNGSDKFPLNVIAGYKFRLYDIHQRLKEKKISELPTPEKYNIITVDWSVDSAKYEGVEHYKEAKEKIGQVGDTVANFIEMLMQKYLIRSLQDVHIIGFSLGAQMASIIGAILKNRNLEGRLLGRITGLDPANPLFERGEGLNKKDAAFVDVIHSSIGDPDYDFYKLGTSYNNGDMDVYLCERCKNKWAASCETIQNNDDLLACYHNMATNWFAVSIMDYKDNSFATATKFTSWWDWIFHFAMKKYPQPKVLFGEFAAKRNAGEYCFCDIESSAEEDQKIIDFHTGIEECMVGWTGTTKNSEHCVKLLKRWNEYYQNSEYENNNRTILHY